MGEHFHVISVASQRDQNRETDGMEELDPDNFSLKNWQECSAKYLLEHALIVIGPDWVTSALAVDAPSEGFVSGFWEYLMRTVAYLVEPVHEIQYLSGVYMREQGYYPYVKQLAITPREEDSELIIWACSAFSGKRCFDK